MTVKNRAGRQNTHFWPSKTVLGAEKRVYKQRFMRKIARLGVWAVMRR
ncbi:MAG: hypothetical protein WCK57_04890 [Verrucomicrobiae bacterium]